MKRGKFFTVEIPLYNIDIAVSIGQDDATLLKEVGKRYKLTTEDMDKIFEPFWKGTFLGRLTFIKQAGPCILRLRYPPNNPDRRGTLAHEVFHAVYRILRTRGMKLCFKSEESYTYLTGHITREIYKNL
jgi:hypothetical protein